VAALSGSQACVEEQRKIYRERREVLCGGLEAAGFEVLRPQATFYVLVRCPKGTSSVQFTNRLLDAGVVATPATGFGSMGEGYIRLTLCADVARMREAAARIQTVKP
jgi:LL-diaminopimelate aminotransferase